LASIAAATPLGSPIVTFAYNRPMPKVLIGPAPILEIEHAYGPALRAAGYDLVIGRRTPLLTADDLMAQLPGCVASLAGSEPYTAEVIATAAAQDLRVIARAGVGYDGVNVDAATAHGIPVCIGPGTNDNAVGEHAMLLILALAKSLIRQNVETKAGLWPRKAFLPLRGKTVGIIGLGRTGKALARRAAAFDMKLIAYDPVVDRAFCDRYGVAMQSSFEPVFREADFLSFHTPLTPGTRDYLNGETLKLLKPTAFVVNTSRGEVIDESALHAALVEKRIAGAGLDVFHDEPVKAGHPLATLDSVVLTAHTAGIDRQSRIDMATAAAHAIITLLNGEWLPDGWVVNPEVRPQWEKRRKTTT
jgi:D-3-phosphoglycerate dehydrogenase / 2-oxoglutarate reductase